jgi:hypothetical protein
MDNSNSPEYFGRKVLIHEDNLNKYILAGGHSGLKALLPNS